MGKTYELLPKMTPKRLAWLQKLRDRGPRVNGSVVGYHCRRFGWTEFFCETPDGRSVTYDEARREFGEKYWEHIKHSDAEQITALGREMLAKHESPSPHTEE